jgi:hypothetical protein
MVKSGSAKHATRTRAASAPLPRGVREFMLCAPCWNYWAATNIQDQSSIRPALPSPDVRVSRPGHCRPSACKNRIGTSRLIWLLHTLRVR